MLFATAWAGTVEPDINVHVCVYVCGLEDQLLNS